MAENIQKIFTAFVLKLMIGVSLHRDPLDNNVAVQTEHGVMSCYLIAHQDQWKKMSENKQANVAVSVGSSGASSSNTERGRSK